MSGLAVTAALEALANLSGMAKDHPDAVARFLGEHNITPAAIAKLQSDLDAIVIHDPKPAPDAPKE